MIILSPLAEHSTRNSLSQREIKRNSIFKYKLTPATSRLELENQMTSAMISTSVCTLGDICSCLPTNCQVSCSEIKRIILHVLIPLSISP